MKINNIGKVILIVSIFLLAITYIGGWHYILNLPENISMQDETNIIVILMVGIIVIFTFIFMGWVLSERHIDGDKPSSEGFEGQASGCEKAEKPRDEGN